MTEHPDIQIDHERRILTIYGIRYDMELFRHMGMGPLNQPIQIIQRADGAVTLQILPKETSQ